MLRTACVPILLSLGSLRAGSTDAAPGSFLEVRDGYRARFLESQVEFTAGRSQGEGAPRLRLRLAAIGRGLDAEEAPAVLTRTRQADSVHYRRGELVETYELRDAGLEQSFRFERLPAGAGDLVVRVQIDTQLPLQHARTDEVEFGDDQLGRVRIGAVLGIDATGERAKGALRWSAGTLEMSLPAAFVERASLPLVLDPLISSPGVVSTFHLAGPTAVPVIDVAHLAPANRYYATWTWNDLSEGGGGVSGQLMEADGALVGGPLSLLNFSTGPFYASDTRVAGVAGARRFAIGMIGGLFVNSNPWMASVDELGALTRAKSYLGTTGDVSSIAVGGEATAADDDALLAYTPFSRKVGLLEIDATTLTLQQSRDLTPSGSGDQEVAITPTGGAAGRYLVTWRRGFVGSDIWAAVIDRDLNVLVAAFPVTSGADTDRRPAVDGDGTSWMIAFQRDTGVSDIVCRGVTYDPGAGTVSLTPERVVQGDPAVDERSPSVAWMGESYLVGHAEQYSGIDYDVFVTSVESLGCAPCEGESTVFNPPTADRPVRIASQRSAGGAGDEAMLVWNVDTGVPAPPPLGQFGLIVHELQQRRFRAADGAVTDLGGGCAPGGAASATCGHFGTNAFGLRLQHAAPLVPVLLALGVNQLGFACGTCTLVPDPLALLAAATDAGGEARLTLALPPDLVTVGTKVLAQWIVGASGTCPTLQLSLSNALEVVVE